MNDTALLRRFVDENRDDAFGELVRRRIDVVYATALRQLGGDAHRAQDVTQQVFIDLARKARALSGHPSLLGWLYTSTHYAALKCRRTEARRQRREEEAHLMEDLTRPPGSGADWERVRPVLDAAMHEMGERDRRVVLMRYFARQTFAAIGVELGLSENAAQRRAERALEKLHALLVKRGITSTSAALGSVLAHASTATAPAGLAASITGAAVSGAAGAGTLAAALVFMNATKVTLSLAAAGAVVIGSAVYQVTQARAADADLAEARAAHGRAAAELVELEDRVNAAEKERALALDRRRTAVAAVATTATPTTAPAVDVNAKYRQIAIELAENDAELRRAQRVNDRHRAVDGHRSLFSSLRLTPAQIEQVTDILASENAKPGETMDAFRTAFGEAAAQRLAEFRNRENGDARNFVNLLSAKLHHADAPFTPRQAEQLGDAVKVARTELRFPLQPDEKAFDIFSVRPEPVEWSRACQFGRGKSLWLFLPGGRL